MEKSTIQTVGELIQALEAYPVETPTAVFDRERGYTSVSISKEKGEDSPFPWLSINSTEKTKLAPVGKLINFLKQCPKNMLIKIRAENDQLSNVYLAMDALKEGKVTIEWLVISDKQSYEDFFLDLHPDLKTKAMEKLENEIREVENPTLRKIVNWLSKQSDYKLFEGILKEDRSIAQSMTYSREKAHALLINGTNCVQVDDEVVFDWIKEYFMLNELPEMLKPKEIKVNTKAKNHVGKNKAPQAKANTEKKSKKEDSGQIDLFGEI